MIESDDPVVAPDPAQWHPLSEVDAIDLVTAYHENGGGIDPFTGITK